MRGPLYPVSWYSTELLVLDGNPGDANKAFWHWPSKMYSPGSVKWIGTASLLRNNAAGSDYTITASKLKAPRALVMDMLPERCWYNNVLLKAPQVHRQKAFNVLFADSSVFTNPCTNSVFMNPQNLLWTDKFVYADATHPCY